MQFKLTLLFFYTISSLFGQSIEKKIHVSLINSKVTIDGNLDGMHGIKLNQVLIFLNISHQIAYSTTAI